MSTEPTPTTSAWVQKALALVALVLTVLWLILYIVNQLGVEKAILFVLVTFVIWRALQYLAP